jgi:hypothetical protein
VVEFGELASEPISPADAESLSRVTIHHPLPERQTVAQWRRMREDMAASD